MQRKAGESVDVHVYDRDEVMAELEAIKDLPDSEIALDDPDAPEVHDWSDAVRGLLGSAPGDKVLLKLDLDADIAAYYEAKGPDFRARMNRDLRLAMLRELQQQHRRAS